MMKIDAEFLREVQRRGWSVESVTGDACIVRCSTVGCGVRVKLRPGGPIQPRASDFSPGVPVESYTALVQFLRDRRDDLALSAAETEEAAGLSVDHVLKAEQVPPKRTMSLDFLLLWIQALGYRLVLEPVGLPAITLHKIATSRNMEPTRSRRVRRQRSGRERRGA